MKYTEVTITLPHLDPFRDLLVDALGNEGPYDSFVETPDGVKAYVPEHLFDQAFLDAAIADLGLEGCQATIAEMPDKNWNEAWEQQHKAVLVTSPKGSRIYVRAPFHEPIPEADYDLVIEPKMSFGTAHHPTTHLMLSYLADLPMSGKRVLDMGCGTAVLGILASMRGASQVLGIDVDEWAYRNALENVERNDAAMEIRIGDASLLKEEKTPFDLILANINRNILLADMAAYASVLAPNGTLLLSGFYQSDIPVLQAHAESLGLTLQETQVRDNWTALRLERI